MRSKVYLATDERMLLHTPILAPSSAVNCGEALKVSQDPTNDEQEILEIPSRLEKILDKLKATYGEAANINDDRESTASIDDAQNADGKFFVNLPCAPASKDMILLAHSEAYYEELKQTTEMNDEELLNMTDKLGEGGDELYFSKGTFVASSTAAGCVARSCEAVLSADLKSNHDQLKPTRAICVVRPPGHHACEQNSMGFCFFNSSCIAAKWVIKRKMASRVLILDWDIHHGNGIQDIVYDDPNIMYVSLHRFGNSFYPGTGNPNEIGNGYSVGTNVNIAWTKRRMGNVEYSAAMSELVLPIVLDFNPELVIVSCGFDAVEGDHIGDCNLSPDFFGSMTKSLIATLGFDIPIVIALEGGYNVDLNALCMESVASALINYGPSQISPTSSSDIPLRTYSPFSAEYTRGNSLALGKSIFHDYWPQKMDNISSTLKPQRIQLSAIKAINKTMKIYMQHVSSENLSLNLIDERESSVITTRSKRYRSRMKQTDEDFDLELSLAQLSLGL